MVVTRQDSGETGVWCKSWWVWLLELGGSGAGSGGVVKSRTAVVFLTNGMEGKCWW